MLETDPTQLLPLLLDNLVALGDLARQISHALDGNGHRREKAAGLQSLKLTLQCLGED